MFRENMGHLQGKLFSAFTMMSEKARTKLNNSWAALFYEHVFCKIDEKPFAVLYCEDNGRPNAPINVLLGFEFIKHMKNFSDLEMFEQLDFNYQIIHALGGQDIGDNSFAKSTLYEFRRRTYQYTVQNPDQEDLIFGQFEGLTENFMNIAGLSTKEQRMDSTQIMTNIKLAGRVSLAFDVLRQAIKACPVDIIPDSHKKVLDPEYKTDTLYRLKGNGERMVRLQEMINLGTELLALVESRPDILQLYGISILKRFISEQAYYDFGKNSWIVKDNKDIAANSLQSAYDPDATYRKKSGKRHVGDVANICETCADENPVQMITDYCVEQNIKGDSEMLEERLESIKERTDVSDINIDGAYFGGNTEKSAQELGVNLHYTNMTGSEPDPEKISLTAFAIKDHKEVTACPQGHSPYSCQYNGQSNAIIACFNRDVCAACPSQGQCPVTMRKNNAVLKIEQKAIYTAEARDKVEDKQARREAGRKRAAIEGTMSSLKRSQGAGRLRVRGLVKVRLVIGMKVIAHNFVQLVHYCHGYTRAKSAKIPPKNDQGVTAPI